MSKLHSGDGAVEYLVERTGITLSWQILKAGVPDPFFPSCLHHFHEAARASNISTFCLSTCTNEMGIQTYDPNDEKISHYRQCPFGIMLE